MEGTMTYSMQLVQKWSQFLRMIANGLNSLKKGLADHFYNVHYAIGPEGESDIFMLDKEYLELVAGQDGKTAEEVMGGVIESLEIVIREGDKLVQNFTDLGMEIAFLCDLVWTSGLRDYLGKLLAKLQNS